jgi:hypothetical protein
VHEKSPFKGANYYKLQISIPHGLTSG